MSGEVFGRANDERTPLLRPRQEDRGNDDASNPFNYNATVINFITSFSTYISNQTC